MIIRKFPSEYINKKTLGPKEKYIQQEILRKMENIQRKMIKSKWSLVFNNTCIKEND